MVMRWPSKIWFPVTITQDPVPESPLAADQVQSAADAKSSKIWTLWAVTPGDVPRVPQADYPHGSALRFSTLTR